MADWDEFKGRLKGSADRLSQGPWWGVPASVTNAVVNHGNMGTTPAPESGGPGDLSTKTQVALRLNDLNPGGETLRPLDSPAPNVTAAPSLKDQFLSKLQGGGGSGAGGPGGLYSAYMASRRKQVGDYDTDKDLALEQGTNRGAHTMALAELQRQDAARKQRDADIDMDAADKAHQEHQGILLQNMRLADDIGKQKTDPRRLIKNQGVAGNVMHILGGALGGALAAKTGGPNQFLERFDREVSEDIQSQLNEIDNKKASLGARQNVLGQLIQVTGDRRLAVMQYRNMMNESAKQKLLADDAELGIPEVSTAAQQAAQQFQHQQDQLQTGIDHDAWQLAQQRAAAAASAQKAAEAATWQRQKDVFEMGLKKDQLEIDRIKAGKDAGKEDNAAIAETTKRLGDDDVVKNRDLINSLNRKIDPKTGDIVGLGAGAQFRSKLAGTALGPLSLIAPGVGDRIGMSDEERIANQEFKQAALLYQTKVTGSGGSDPQMQKIGEAFKGAGSMAEKRRAITMLKSELDRREGTAMANLSDSQKVELNRRLAREGQTDMPGSVKVTDGNVSDERAKQFKKKLAGGY